MGITTSKQNSSKLTIIVVANLIIQFFRGHAHCTLEVLFSVQHVTGLVNNADVICITMQTGTLMVIGERGFSYAGPLTCYT